MMREGSARECELSGFHVPRTEAIRREIDNLQRKLDNPDITDAEKQRRRKERKEWLERRLNDKSSLLKNSAEPDTIRKGLTGIPWSHFD